MCIYIFYINLLSLKPKNASELLKQRHYYENSMSVEEYYSLGKNNQLSWKYLSANSCAIELLKANPVRIH